MKKEKKFSLKKKGTRSKDYLCGKAMVKWLLEKKNKQEECFPWKSHVGDFISKHFLLKTKYPFSASSLVKTLLAWSWAAHFVRIWKPWSYGALCVSSGIFLA
jgi:hypothetical protein